MRYENPVYVRGPVPPTACASTHYHANAGGRDGGYREQRIDEITYSVTFLANHSSDEATRNNLLARCGDLAFRHGYSYFNVVSPITGNDNEMSVTIKFANVAVLGSHAAVTAPVSIKTN